MSKLHRWSKKIKGIVEITEPFEHGFRLSMKVKNVMECAHCGLKKGTIKTTYYSSHVTIYFDEKNRLLSRNLLPYKCIGKQKDFYLSKDEFYV